MQIAEHLRKAARFQFLAEFLKDQKIPELKDQKLPAIRGKLGGHKFYCFVTTPKQLLKISFVNHRSLNDPDGAPTYQRLVNRSRMKQISQFLLKGGFFPTNILINFIKAVRFDPVSKDPSAGITFGTLYMPDRYRSAWIIDGQHRLYGFAPLDEKHLNQNIIVLAFEKMNKAEEANLFVTINHEQKSVPKTLLDDLEGELKWGSDVPSERVGAISARLIGILNVDIGEALYGRVTQQGITATEKTCLTIPALKNGLRRSGLVGKSIMKHKEYDPGPLCGSSDPETLDRARAVLNLYFELIRSNNHSQWEMGRKGFLCTNVAIEAYLQLLAAIIAYMETNKGLEARELSSEELVSEIEEYLDPVTKLLSMATLASMEKTFKVQFGGGGPREYFFRLCRIVKEQFSDFEPQGMDEWSQEQSAERIEMADRKLKNLNIMVQRFIFNKFKQKYGDKNDAYWYKGVIDKSIKSRAYTKSLDDDDDARLPLENYLDFIEYKKIVENKAHWLLFKPTFDITEPGEKGYSKNIRWMERVNELRRISAHATENRYYKLDDFEYIDYIYEKFTKRISEPADGS
jgi:DGQHR domain-containing protein